jgi:hypothetical protein
MKHSKVEEELDDRNRSTDLKEILNKTKLDKWELDEFLSDTEA